MQKTIYSRESRLLSALLKEIRVARGLTQGELAHKVKMKHNDVSKMELGQRRVGFVELRHLLHALDFDIISFELLFAERLPALASARLRIPKQIRT